MNRPERVLQKGAHQTVTCKCGHSFKVDQGERKATCPKCNQPVNWGLRK